MCLSSGMYVFQIFTEFQIFFLYAEKFLYYNVNTLIIYSSIWSTQV